MRTRASILIADVDADEDYVKMTEGIKSELAVPVIMNDVAVGVLNVESKTPAAFDKSQEMLLQILARHLATAICNVKNLQQIENFSRKLQMLVVERTRELESAQAQLIKSERLAAIGELSAMVGHDLRNPLTSIKSAAYLLKKRRNLQVDEKDQEMLDIIDKSIDYSNKIINDLLEYSREIQLDLTESTPQEIMEETLSSIEIPPRIALVNHVQNAPRIKVDADKMKRVFLNVIKNSLDAMPTQGKLQITSKPAGNTVSISFKDTGIGISEADLKKIFKPLFTTKAQGMGFGLSICKRIVEAHNGRINIESAVGRGTTLTVTLPVTPENPDKTALIAAEETQELSQR